MNSRIIAGKSPLLQILPRGLFQLGLGAVLVWLAWASIQDRSYEGRQMLIFRLFLTLPLGLIFLRYAAANLQRPFLKGSITSDDERILLRLPRFPFWGCPFRVIVESSLPWQELKELRWTVGNRSKLLLASDRESVLVEPTDFNVGIHHIDGELRKVAAQRGLGHLPVIAPFGDFVSTSRLLTAGFGLALAVVGFALTALTASDSGRKSKGDLPFYIPIPIGIGLLVLASRPRTRILVDPRGILREQGGKTSFLPWHALSADWGNLSNEGGLWMTFTVTGRDDTGKAEYTLYRVLGVGLPIVQLANLIEELRDPRVREEKARRGLRAPSA